MKRILPILFLSLPIICYGQIITTVAGCDTCSSLADGIPATTASISVGGLFLDDSENIYVSDQTNNRLRKVTAATGIITTAVTLNSPVGGCFDLAGSIIILEPYYVRKYNTLTHTLSLIAGVGTTGFSGDGGPATNAQFAASEGIAMDATGNIYVADVNNFRIRKINTATGIITTFAGGGSNISEGAPATDASLNNPTDVAVDVAGNIYIAAQNQTIRKVNPTTGMISTVAGKMYMSGYTGNSGPATNAELNFPNSVDVDASGNIYIADEYNYVIRKVNASTHIITTIAGNGTYGYSGDGGPATNAQIRDPKGVVVSHSGNVYVGDGNVVRKISVSKASVNQISSNSFIQLFPNPTQNSLTITSTDKITNVAITSLLGQTLYTHDYNAGKAEIDVSTLPPGIYLIRINGTEVRKFVKE